MLDTATKDAILNDIAKTLVIRPEIKPDPHAALITERGKTHGDFSDHAAATQRLKAVMRDYANWHELTDVQKESLEMIAHKIGRILAGDPNFPDHWDDIVGYAKLVSQRCTK